jgi:hypothetical protein
LVGGEEEEGCEEHPTDEGDEGHGCSTRGRGGGCAERRPGRMRFVRMVWVAVVHVLRQRPNCRNVRAGARGATSGSVPRRRRGGCPCPGFPTRV